MKEQADHTGDNLYVSIQRSGPLVSQSEQAVTSRVVLGIVGSDEFTSDVDLHKAGDLQEEAARVGGLSRILLHIDHFNGFSVVGAQIFLFGHDGDPEPGTGAEIDLADEIGANWERALPVRNASE